ncbi:MULTISPECIES: hypothetical protein [Cetobacterium]|uniref:hypothetical protein n=1 Tax=Cetobacterium TaxID=180162 RepID=UPI00163D19B5|nr:MULTISPECIES: hypothetical protein [Cetobacterium]MBC2854789.1 hypothetical protein [Cetobacterium sp. 2G large]WVJ02524.1 hypothetical protein VSU16_10555 [Cetobacterium somerae]
MQNKNLGKNRKIIFSGVNVYIDESVPQNKNYKIFKVLKIPFFPMVIDVETF